jgi:hypothetical protein
MEKNKTKAGDSGGRPSQQLPLENAAHSEAAF